MPSREDPPCGDAQSKSFSSISREFVCASQAQLNVKLESE